jgi:hypothetical protein
MSSSLGLSFLLRLRLRPSFSVPESLSVIGPSVSVALSPSVVDGVVEPSDAVDKAATLRRCSLKEVFVFDSLREVFTGINGVR